MAALDLDPRVPDIVGGWTDGEVTMARSSNSNSLSGLRWAAFVVASLAISACGGGALEVVGTYTTNFSTEEIITETNWGPTTVEDFDNGDNWAITKNAADAQFGPNTYSRLIWTEPDAAGVFFYCTVAFGIPTLELAQTSTQTADASNPSMGGCGGFTWTQMTPK